MADMIERQQAIDALRAMQTYKMFAGDDLLLIDQAGAQTELMMLPSAQPVSYSYGHENDVISRQAVIDALKTCYDTEIKEYTDGSEWIDYEQAVDLIEDIPSTQPDIIRCKDCAYCDSDVVDIPYGMTKKVWWCDRLYAEANENLIVEPDDFCSWAERREDG